MADIKFGINIEASIDKAKGALGNLAKASKDAMNNIKTSTQHAMGQFSNQMSSNAEKAKLLKEKMEGIGIAGKSLAIGAGIAAAALTGLAVASLKLAGTAEQQRVAFKGLLGTYEEADKVMARIKKEAAVTPFDVESLTRMTQQITAITKDGQKAVDVLMDIGDAVAMSGKDVVEMERVVLNLQQIASTGKLTAMDVKQFQGAIPIFNDILAASGLTVESLQKSSNAAELLFGAFKKAASEGGVAFGGLDMQSKTLNGTLSTLKDNFDGILRQLGEELMPIVKPIVDFFNKLLNNFQELPKPLKQTAAILVAVGIAMTTIVTLIGGLLLLLPALITATTTLGISMNVAFFGIPALIAGITVAMALLIKNWDTVSDFLLDSFDNIKITFLMIIKDIVKVIEKMITLVNKLPGIEIKTKFSDNITAEIEKLEGNISKRKIKVPVLVTGETTGGTTPAGAPKVVTDEQSKLSVDKFKKDLTDMETAYYDSEIAKLKVTDDIAQKKLDIENNLQLKKLEMLQAFAASGTTTEEDRLKVVQEIANLEADIAKKTTDDKIKLLEKEQAMYKKMTDTMVNSWDTQLGFFGSFAEGMKNIAKDIAIDYLKGIMNTTIADTAAGVARAVASKDFIGAGMIAATGATQVAIIQSSIGAVQGLETGGIVTGNTIAELGEKNKKEAVIPLEREDSRELLREVAGGSSGDITVHNQMIIEGDTFDLLTRKITNNQAKLTKQGRL